MTKEEVQALIDASKERVYHTYDQLPAYARETIRRMHIEGVFAGAGPGDMDLPHSMMRILLINARQGVYGDRYNI